MSSRFFSYVNKPPFGRFTLGLFKHVPFVCNHSSFLIGRSELGIVRSLIFKASSRLSCVTIETIRLLRLVRSLSTQLGCSLLFPVKLSSCFPLRTRHFRIKTGILFINPRFYRLLGDYKMIHYKGRAKFSLYIYFIRKSRLKFAKF